MAVRYVVSSSQPLKLRETSYHQLVEGDDDLRLQHGLQKDNIETPPPKYCKVLEKDAMKTIKEFLKKRGISRNVNILVIGRTGEGKSSLINSLIELGKKIAPEGALTGCCTATTQSYIYPNIIPGVTVTIIDTPGLQDTQNNEHKYIQEMKNECHEISLILYCIKMTNKRLINDDKVAMKKLDQMFGQKFWERVVFVQTFANGEMLEKWDERDKDNESEEPDDDDVDAWKKLKKERLTGRVQYFKEELAKFFTKHVRHDIIQEVEFNVCPAGYHVRKHDAPISFVDWKRDFLKICFKTMEDKHLLNIQLSKKIALAVLIDNRGEVKVENEERILNDEAAALNKAFENLDFAVLYFNSLSSESIATLLEAISEVDHSQLLMIAVVFLSKGKTAELYDADGVAVSYEDVFRHFPRCPKPLVLLFDSVVDETQKKKDFTIDDILNINLPLHICPQNFLILAARHNSASSPVVKEFTEKLSHTSVQECFETVCANNNSTTVKSIWHDTVGDNVFIIKSINDSIDTLEQKLEIYHSIWYPIRCKTIDKIEENKEEIMSIVFKERATKIGATFSGMVLGGSLVVTGIALAPFTFGGSIVVSVIGGAVGAAAAGTGIGATIFSKIFSHKQLKKAQQHINLDQQISLILNNDAKKYIEIVTSSHIPESSLLGLQGAVAIGRGAGAGIAIGVEGTLETAALVLRTTGRVAGMALVGVSLAVTVPVDIAFIVYNVYHLHKSRNDPTGKNESDKAVKSLYNQIETLLKGMCLAINEVEYEVQAERNILKDAECGYEIQVPVKDKEKHTVTVRTLFSGPFVFPDGYTLVSAVYDITMPELPQPATIKLEHCVDESDQTRSDLMCYAIGSVDLKNKKIMFEKVDTGSPLKAAQLTQPPEPIPSPIKQKSSCLLCILYKSKLEDKTLVKYAAHCFYEKKYENFWILNIVFTKHLKAHFKHATSCRASPQGPCQFVFISDKLLLDLTCFKDTKNYSGWIVSPNNDEKLPDTISMQEIDTAELRSGSAQVQKKKAFPSISLYVYVNEEDAAYEINKSFKIEGTNLNINIKLHKE
ncbi:PREDICTED: uncharacterized protein LOC109581356 [Amphimedon queenslandica]|uniref:Caspase family p20 domain-containing protein n=1 Tax=Amphimedon queenslandica TaxID=400682 RepID=A0A1X7V3S2_AMPQE|nr:PREDICTED: uncharacterized protein LOC109581356 [Amphimedon queenslandica]|eukprot:XP_019850975.1 PREDICTED: uncharacterized protein LOC109581356 [Amphimedon queenslandica]